MCIHPRKTGGDVMATLENRDGKHTEEKKLFMNLVDLLSYEKIIFNGRIFQTGMMGKFESKN